MANAPVEAKVLASTAAAFIVGAVAAFLNFEVADSQLMGSLPSWAQLVVTTLVPPVATFLSGWSAKHTPRTNTGDVLTPEI